MYSMASNYVKQRQKEKRRRRSIYMPFKERPKDNQSKVNKINTYARKTFFCLNFCQAIFNLAKFIKIKALQCIILFTYIYHQKGPPPIKKYFVLLIFSTIWTILGFNIFC